MLYLALVLSGLNAPLHAMTGGDWYTNCRELMVLSAAQQESAPADKKIKYRECQIEAYQAFCDIISSSKVKANEKNVNDQTKNEQDGKSLAFLNQERQEIRMSCPTGKPFIAAVNAIEETGGPGFIYKWLPASYIIKNALQNKYPTCVKVREELKISIQAKACYDFWLNNINTTEQKSQR